MAPAFPVGRQPGAWRLDSVLHPSTHLPLFWEPGCSRANPTEPQAPQTTEFSLPGIVWNVTIWLQIMPSLAALKGCG